jgi:NAD(P)-dependent dehydrogenase (short-subunit alcohol dehydrogenase family)
MIQTLRRLWCPQPISQENNMSAKNVLITGANKSIGFETARQFGQLGLRVWLGSRDSARGDEAAKQLVDEGYDVQPLRIDVTQDDSVQSAMAQIRDEDGRLDILINNAGILGNHPSIPSLQSVNDMRKIYDTNVFGAVRVTQAFLPLLTAARHASVVMVSSGLGSLGWLSDPDNEFYGVNILGYNSSKSALNAVTVSFAKELATSGITVNSVDPGYTSTDFNGHSGYRTVEQAAAGIVWLATQDTDRPTGSFYFEQQKVPW